MSRGYELADGSLSTDYKIGDKFVVTSCKANNSPVHTGQVLTYEQQDGSSCPVFGSGGGACFYFYWKWLIPAREKQKTKEITTEKGQYIIVSATAKAVLSVEGLQNLEDEINTRMKEGYVTKGDLTIVGQVIIQPMVLPEGNIIE